MKSAAQRLGLNIGGRRPPSTNWLMACAAGKYDVAVGGITVTDERLNTATMVTTASTATQWAGPAGSAITPGRACGATVAVQKGTVFVTDLEGRSEACKTAGEPPITIAELQDNTGSDPSSPGGKG